MHRLVERPDLQLGRRRGGGGPAPSLPRGDNSSAAAGNSFTSWQHPVVQLTKAILASLVCSISIEIFGYACLQVILYYRIIEETTKVLWAELELGFCKHSTFLDKINV